MKLLIVTYALWRGLFHLLHFRRLRLFSDAARVLLSLSASFPRDAWFTLHFRQRSDDTILFIKEIEQFQISPLHYTGELYFSAIKIRRRRRRFRRHYFQAYILYSNTIFWHAYRLLALLRFGRARFISDTGIDVASSCMLQRVYYILITRVTPRAR